MLLCRYRPEPLEDDRVGWHVHDMATGDDHYTHCGLTFERAFLISERLNVNQFTAPDPWAQFLLRAMRFLVRPAYDWQEKPKYGRSCRGGSCSR